MPNATLVINQPDQAIRELKISGGAVSIGRALDNTICLDGDTNVSRYHALIEARDGGYWLSDLGSSNGTTLNDIPVGYERKLKDGDSISVGGTSIIDFTLREEAPPETQPAPSVEAYPAAPNLAAPNLAAPNLAAPNLAAPDIAAAQQIPAAVSQPPAASSAKLIILAVGGGLVLTGIIAVVLISKFSTKCQASVRILSPQTGTTIRGPVPIKVEAEETKCIDRVIFQIDGTKFASSETAPYEVTFDPAALQDLSGGNHVLSVTVEDEDGNRKLQPDTVLLAYDDGKSKQASEVGAASGQSGSTDRQSSESRAAATAVGTFEVKDMVARLAKQINAKKEYVFDREFIQQAQSRTGEYVAAAGYYERARPFQDVINDAFTGVQGLEPPLGYVTAMSRSRFSLTKGRGAPEKSTSEKSASDKSVTERSATERSAGDDVQGLWQVSPSLAQSTGYIGQCKSATLSDADQKCSAIVAAMYMKFLVVDIFSGDYVYAIACFGMLPKDAATFRDGLPADRRDFWKVLKSAEQRDRVARFFAAGIVGENPQKFGLTKDRPLSNLYPKK